MKSSVINSVCTYHERLSDKKLSVALPVARLSLSSNWSLSIKIIVFIVTMICGINPANAQYVFTIINLKNQPVSGASIEISRITGDAAAVTYKVTPAYDGIANRYRLDISEAELNICNLRITHTDYATSEGALADAVKLPEIRLGYTKSLFFKYQNWDFPYCISQELIVVYPTPYAEKHPEKFLQLLQKNGFLEAEATPKKSSEYFKGLVIKKADNSSFSYDHDSKIAVLRKMKKWIQFAGPLISCAGSGETITLSDEFTATFSCTVKEAKQIIRSHGCKTIRLKGSRKTSFRYAIIKGPPDISYAILQLVTDFKKAGGVLSSEIRLIEITERTYDFDATQ